MKNSMKLLFAGAALMSTLFYGCKKDDPIPSNTDGLVFIATGNTDGGNMKVNLYASDSLYARYTQFYVEVRNATTDAVIEDAHVSLNPLMDMGSMTHSAPFENPSSSSAVNGLFPCAVVFQMPGDMGWTLEVHVHDHVDGNEGAVTFPLVIKNPAVTRTRVITPENGGNKVVISYVQPLKPKVGINDLEITLHEKESGMAWPGIGNYTVEIDPQMPSMGHGSPNNVNPTHAGNGHYKGKVNFTMTGAWRIYLKIMDGTAVVDSTSYFDITIQ